MVAVLGGGRAHRRASVAVAAALGAPRRRPVPVAGVGQPEVDVLEGDAQHRQAGQRVAARERPAGEVVQHLHLVLGVDGHVAVVGQFRRHGQLAGRHAFGQAEADGHRAEVAAADGLRRPRRHDLLAEEHGHPVGQRLHLVHVVRRQQHGGAGARQAADQLPRVATAGRVEAGGGLVEEEQLGVADDAEPDIEASLLAARQPLDALVRLLGQPDQLDHLVDRPRVRVVAGVARQHLAHRVVRLDGELLEHHADLCAQPALGGVVGRVDAERLDAPGAARAEALEDLDRRRLAGAVGAEQREHLALLHLEADVVHGHGVAVGLGQVLHGDRRHGGEAIGRPREGWSPWESFSRADFFCSRRARGGGGQRRIRRRDGFLETLHGPV